MPLQYAIGLFCQQVISYNARVFANDVAVVYGRYKLTWREVDEETNRFANALLKSGLRPGDRVALLMSSGLESFIAFWGIEKGGFVAVPLDVRGDSLCRLLDDARARAAIADPSTTVTLDRIRGKLPTVEDGKYLTVGDAAPGWTSITARAAALPATPPSVTISPEDSVAVL